MRILIVEDEPAIAELIAVNLRHNGFRTTWAIDSASAQIEIDASVPDLILLDIMMPGMSGPVISALPDWLTSSLVYLSAALLGGVLGALVYLVCFRFLPLDQPLATLMSTVGMLLLLEEAIVHATAGMPQNYPSLFAGVVFDMGPFMVRGDLLFVFGLGCAAMVGLKLMLEKTRLGLATRAVAQQSVAARLCGMSVSTTNATTFIIAGFLGGTAGAMTGAAIGVLSPLLTLPMTVKGLVVTVIGGLGSIPGAIIAGLVVGGVENLFQFLRGVSERDIYVMLMLFAFLVFRPGGLFAAPGGRD